MSKVSPGGRLWARALAALHGVLLSGCLGCRGEPAREEPAPARLPLSQPTGLPGAAGKPRTVIGASCAGNPAVCNAGLIAAGRWHTLAVKSDGSIWGWGFNVDGELGDTTTIDRQIPMATSKLTSGVVAVAAGYRHSLAVKSDGSAWSWGYDEYGQLGDDDNADMKPHPTPAPISALSNVISVAGGLEHSVALKEDGTVWDWGYNAWGELGDGTFNNHFLPVQAGVPPDGGNNVLPKVIAIAAGAYFTVALAEDQTVWGWGENAKGQLGDNNPITQQPNPVHIPSNILSNVIAIAAGGYHTLALDSNRKVWAWGWNDRGQLGDGMTSNQASPVLISTLDDVISVAAGDKHSVALRNDGTVWAWGLNDTGQLGNNSSDMLPHSIPQKITMPGPAVAVEAGTGHTVALDADGTVWAWGDNSHGQIGNNMMMAQQGTPVHLPFSLPDQCHLPDICDPSSHCAAQAKLTGTPCGNPCATAGTCQMGNCSSMPLPNGTPCLSGDGACFNGACLAFQGKPCTQGSGCQSGFCVQSLCCDAPCNRACQACTKAETGQPDGVCAFLENDKCDCKMPPMSNDTPCNNGNPCQQGICMNNTCVGLTPLSCPATKECDQGYCDPNNGQCLTIHKLDNTPCTGGLCIAGGCFPQGASTSSASGASGSAGAGGASAASASSSAASGSTSGGGGTSAAPEDAPPVLHGGGCACHAAPVPRSLPPWAPIALAILLLRRYRPLKSGRLPR